MTREHTVTSYDDDLNQLREMIARMAGLAESQIAAGIEALNKRNLEAARKVVAGDAEIDLLEHEIEKAAITMLALRAPVADDLREVVAVLKFTSELERIGDYAKNIAKRVPAISASFAGASGGHSFIASRALPEMAGIVRKMLKDVIDAYIDRDSARAIDVWERDEAVDDLNNSLFRELLTYMMEDPRAITSCTHLLFISKNIERMGDHITNIAENVYYLTEGEMLEQKRPKSDRTSMMTPCLPDTPKPDTPKPDTPEAS